MIMPPLCRHWLLALSNKMESPARLTAYQPHMHNRGKAQCIEAIYPDMPVEQLNVTVAVEPRSKR